MYILITTYRASNQINSTLQLKWQPKFAKMKISRKIYGFPLQFLNLFVWLIADAAVVTPNLQLNKLKTCVTVYINWANERSNEENGAPDFYMQKVK